MRLPRRLLGRSGRGIAAEQARQGDAAERNRALLQEMATRGKLQALEAGIHDEFNLRQLGRWEVL